MIHHGFVRVAAAAPALRVADCEYNAGRIAGLVAQAERAGVGLLVRLDDQLFNCAAVIFKGKILGLVPKSFLPNYKEFYEDRWFSPGVNARSKQVTIDGTAVPFGTDLLFDAADAPGLTVGV